MNTNFAIPARPTAGVSRRTLAVGLLSLAWPAMLSCTCPPPIEKPNVAAALSYTAIAESFNRRIARLDGKLKAECRVLVRRMDDEGEHLDRCDAKLAIMLPNRLRFSATHLGVSGPLFWAGSNEEHYWLFDLREDKRLYFGRHDQYEDKAADELQLPVHPRQLPRLLGLLPLADEPAQPPDVAVDEGRYVIESNAEGWRMALDAETFAPQRVELLNEQGETAAVAILSQPAAVEIEDAPPDGRTKVSSHIEIFRPGGADTIELRLSEIGLSNYGFKDAWFDFDALRKHFAVPAEAQVNVDE